jgi:hypothetical protein
MNRYKKWTLETFLNVEAVVFFFQYLYIFPNGISIADISTSFLYLMLNKRKRYVNGLRLFFLSSLYLIRTETSSP